MNTITWYLAPWNFPYHIAAKLIIKFKVPSLLNRFPRLISFPEIRNTVAEDIIGVLLVVASQSHELDNLLGSLVGKRLPETGYHAGYQRR